MDNNSNGKRKEDETSENICDVSLSSGRKSSLYSQSFVLSNQSDKQQRSISDPRTSLQGFSSQIKSSTNNSRRSTVICVPLSSNEKKDNEIIFHVPFKKYFNV